MILNMTNYFLVKI